MVLPREALCGGDIRKAQSSEAAEGGGRGAHRVVRKETAYCTDSANKRLQAIPFGPLLMTLPLWQAPGWFIEPCEPEVV
jgi:hypothetical protein